MWSAVKPDMTSAPKRGPGRPRDPNAKVRESFRISPDVLAALKARGRGWTSHVDDLLRSALGL